MERKIEDKMAHSFSVSLILINAVRVFYLLIVFNSVNWKSFSFHPSLSHAHYVFLFFFFLIIVVLFS